jgi:hypothetical protein
LQRLPPNTLSPDEKNSLLETLPSVIHRILKTAWNQGDTNFFAFGRNNVDRVLNYRGENIYPGSERGFYPHTVGVRLIKNPFPYADTLIRIFVKELKSPDSSYSEGQLSYMTKSIFKDEENKRNFSAFYTQSYRATNSPQLDPTRIIKIKNLIVTLAKKDTNGDFVRLAFKIAHRDHEDDLEIPRGGAITDDAAVKDLVDQVVANEKAINTDYNNNALLELDQIISNTYLSIAAESEADITLSQLKSICRLMHEKGARFKSKDILEEFEKEEITVTIGGQAISIRNNREKYYEATIPLNESANKKNILRRNVRLAILKNIFKEN